MRNSTPPRLREIYGSKIPHAQLVSKKWGLRADVPDLVAVVVSLRLPPRCSRRWGRSPRGAALRFGLDAVGLGCSSACSDRDKQIAHQLRTEKLSEQRRMFHSRCPRNRGNSSRGRCRIGGLCPPASLTTRTGQPCARKITADCSTGCPLSSAPGNTLCHADQSPCPETS